MVPDTPPPSVIKRLRIGHNLTINEAAEMMCCTRQQWGRYESGRCRMPKRVWKMFNLLLQDMPLYFDVDEAGNIVRHLINPMTGQPYEANTSG